MNWIAVCACAVGVMVVVGFGVEYYVCDIKENLGKRAKDRGREWRYKGNRFRAYEFTSPIQLPHWLAFLVVVFWARPKGKCVCIHRDDSHVTDYGNFVTLLPVYWFGLIFEHEIYDAFPGQDTPIEDNPEWSTRLNTYQGGYRFCLPWWRKGKYFSRWHWPRLWLVESCVRSLWWKGKQRVHLIIGKVKGVWR